MYYILEETGRRIAWVRHQRGLSQEKFADELHISRTHLSNLEIGKCSASIDLLVDISNMCNVSLDYLILGRSSAECKLAYKQSVQMAVMECLDKCL